MKKPIQAHIPTQGPIPKQAANLTNNRNTTHEPR